MLHAVRQLAGSVVVLVLVGCGPRAAIGGTGPDVSVPTPDCSARGATVIRPVSTAVAVSGTAVASIAGQSGQPTRLPRAQLVADAVATATAIALIPTPTPPPTSTPTPPPTATSTAAPACATLVSRRPPAVAPAPTSQPAIASTPVMAPTTSAAPPAPQSTTGVTQPALVTPSAGQPAPVTPSPGQPTLVSPTVLLASDNGADVELHVGDQFVLLLGQYTGTDWQVQLSDPSVLQRVGSNGQGVYQAATQGEAELNAIGEPACRRGQPPCGAPSRLVRFSVHVR